MLIARTILALLIALSLAVLPAASGAGPALKSTAAVKMVAIGDMDCCPHKATPCDEAMDGCAAMATCALKCFSFAGGSFLPLVYPVTLADWMPPLQGGDFQSQTSNPPFRPPRV
jgi:hypothetical protein